MGKAMQIEGRSRAGRRSACSRAWGLELGSWYPRNERREPIPESCPLTKRANGTWDCESLPLFYETWQGIELTHRSQQTGTPLLQAGV